MVILFLSMITIHWFKILFELSHTEKRQFNAVFKKILEWRDELNR